MKEKHNWIPRLEIILQEGESNPFPPFDRFSHLKEKSATSIEQKLLELKRLHPAFGVVRVSELISTWVVHDLTHIAQIVRAMAKNYRTDVGPWKEYVSILK